MVQHGEALKRYAGLEGSAAAVQARLAEAVAELDAARTARVGARGVSRG